MIKRFNANKARLKRHYRMRNRLEGTAARPRLSVFRSGMHIYAQVIDDAKGVTIASASSVAGKKAKGTKKTGGNLGSAKEVGKLIAQKAQEKGVKKVIFDRGGYIYHGRVKALADAAREAGLEF